MAKWKKAVFIIVLVAFIAMSVFFSFVALARDTFEFKEQENIGDIEGLNGWTFYGFNGNKSTKDLTIDFVKDKNGENPDLSKKIVAVGDFTIVSDEYVEYIRIGKDVEYISENSFYYCKKLKAVIVDSENPNYCDVDGVLYTKDMKTLVLRPICNSKYLDEKYAESNNGVHRAEEYLEAQAAEFGKQGDSAKKEIAENSLKALKQAYADLNKVIDEATQTANSPEIKEPAAVMNEYFNAIKESYNAEKKLDTFMTERLDGDKAFVLFAQYKIPDTVENIGAYSFYKSGDIIELEIPESVKTIGSMAFFHCDSMKTVRLPESLEFVGSDAFSYCNSMGPVLYVPASVKELEHHAFFSCMGVSEVYLGAKSEEDITTGDSYLPKSIKKGIINKAPKPEFGKTYEDAEARIKELDAAAENK